MIRIAVAGVAGRMGRALVSAVQAQSAANGEIALTHAFERPGHDAVGLNTAVLVSTGEAGVVVTDSIAGGEFDVLIDFTSPESSLSNLEYCAAQGLRAVIGTTGFDAKQRKAI